MSLTEQKWNLDRRVPLVFILALIVQSGAALLWVGQITQRINHIEQATGFAADIGERIVRLEANTSFMRATLQRVERKIDLLHAQKNAARHRGGGE